VWDFPGRRLVTNLVFPDANIFALWFSPRGNLLACGAIPSGDRMAGKLYVGKLWAVAGWNDVSLPALNENNVFDGNFSPDERTVAIGYGNGTAAWWDLATGKRRAFFDCRYASSVHAVFSQDGRHFATGGMDGLMTLWDVATRKAKPIGRGYRNALHDLLFSPDSRRLLASGTSPKDVVKLWDVETARDVATLPGVPGWYVHMGFSPDGNTLFAASMEGTALFWRAPSFEEIAQRESQEPGVKPSGAP
jgi:WD40 repeat protein